MVHLFKRMYLEDITDIEKQFTPGELTTPITIELMKRKIDKLQRQKKSQSLLQRLTSYLVGGTTPTKRNSKLNNNKCGN